MTGGILLRRTEETTLLAGALDIEGGTIRRLGDGDVLTGLDAKLPVGIHRRADDIDVAVRLRDEIAARRNGRTIMRQLGRGVFAKGGVRLALRRRDIDIAV